MRHTFWILILLFALIGAASAIPLLPAEFSGTVTIDGSPAPIGTVITARIDDRDCGSLTLTAAGTFGGTGTFDKRLLVSGEDTDAQKTITFFVDGIPAGTAIYTSGTSADLALAVTKDGTGSDTGGTSSGSTSSGSTSSGPATAPASVTEFTGSSSLQTDVGGAVQSTTVIATAGGDASLTIGQGIRALDHSGTPLGSVSIESIPPADLPGAAESVGRAVRCGPDGATFDPAIRISFTLTSEEWERYGEGQFVVRWYNSGTDTWEPLATTIYSETRTVTATITHFTLVAVFAVPADEIPTTVTPPLTDPTLTFGPVAPATTVQHAGSSLPWFAGFVALAGVFLLVRKG